MSSDPKSPNYWRRNQLTHKTKGRKHAIPQCQTIFPFDRNELQDKLQSSINEIMDKIFEYSLMTPEDFWKHKDVAEFTAYFHPHMTDQGKYLNLTRVTHYFFVMDDHEECFWGEGNRRTEESGNLWKQFHSMLNYLDDTSFNVEVRPPYWKPYIVGYYFGLEEICKDLAADQRRRFVHEYRQYAFANEKEARLIQSGHRVTSLEELFKIRIDTIGLRVVALENEYAYGIHLTDEEYLDPMIDEYLNIVSTVIVIPNDIHSYEKELNDSKDDESRLFNSVAVIKYLDNCPVEEAMSKALKLYEDYELKVRDMQKMIYERSDLSDEMKKYIKLIDHIIGGSFAVHQIVSRYNNFNV